MNKIEKKEKISWYYLISYLLHDDCIEDHTADNCYVDSNNGV